MKFDWSRFKNYGLWVSIFALIPLILKTFGINVVPQEYSTLTTAILAVLVAAGIVNNPTSLSKWYGDDPKEEETKTKEEKQDK